VIDDDAIPFLESAKARAARDDLSAGLVTCDHPWLVALGSFAEMLTVDATDVTSADRRGFHANENLAVARGWNREFVDFDRAIAGQNRTFHHG
jgi:hypothetical protein